MTFTRDGNTITCRACSASVTSALDLVRRRWTRDHRCTTTTGGAA